MDTGGDRGERCEDTGDSGSSVSRRRLLIGGLTVVGGTSALISKTTTARFSDESTATGTTRIDAPPSLNYRIYDQTTNTNAKFKIAWQVNWLADFNRIEITADNLDKSYISPTTRTRYNREGLINYPQNGSHGNCQDDTYEFHFEVYRTGSSQAVISKTVTDEADGNDTSEGDFGNANGPKVTRIAVDDTSRNTNTYYDVSYDLENHTNDCAEVQVVFDNQSNDWADATKPATCSANGSVSYSHGGTMGQEYHITVKIMNSNGIEVDSAMIEDIADGHNSEKHY